MSRVGKKVIIVPQGVVVDVDREQKKINVSGPKGTLNMMYQPYVDFVIQDGQITVQVKDENDRVQKAVWGTTRAVLANLIQGVSTGYKKELELSGVGLRMELGTELTLHIGFSHPVKVTIPPSIKLSLNKNILTGESIDKQGIGDFFTMIHDMKPSDVYKQKGFKFPGRVYRKKVGKKAK